MAEDALYPIEDALILVSKFQDKTLDVFDWTHEAHAVVCLYYLSRYDKKAALPLVRTAIRSYNDVTEKPNTETSGYHETMTVFWLYHIQKCCTRNGKVHFDQATMDDMLWNEQVIGRNVWLTYYSKTLMVSTQARMAFVAPDIKDFD